MKADRDRMSLLSRVSNLVQRGIRNPTEIPAFFLHKTWFLWEALGVHIVPNHYYYPIPDLRDLRAKRFWRNRFPTTGIDLRETEQLALLEELAPFFSEYSSAGSAFEAHGDGPILYAMIRKFTPEKIIEVGSGASTAVSVRAGQRNTAECGSRPMITSIEPYPDRTLQALANRYDNVILREVRGEDVPVDDYLQLEEGDFLFIDSSHVLTTGNDVAYLFLRVLPQLPAGVFVHLHDIRFPADYPKEWVLDEHRFWTEQYLLQAFMMFNDSFEVIWAGNHMSKQYPTEVEAALPNYQAATDSEPGGGWPGSFWIRRTA